MKLTMYLYRNLMSCLILEFPLIADSCLKIILVMWLPKPDNAVVLYFEALQVAIHLSCDQLSSLLLDQSWNIVPLLSTKLQVDVIESIQRRFSKHFPSISSLSYLEYVAVLIWKLSNWGAYILTWSFTTKYVTIQHHLQLITTSFSMCLLPHPGLGCQSHKSLSKDL